MSLPLTNLIDTRIPSPSVPARTCGTFRCSNGSGGNGYQNISEFAWFLNNRNQSPVDTSNPLTYSVVPTYNTMFLHGASISGLNNRTWSRAAQNFMADYAAIMWDGFCEGYYVLNTDTVWANQAAIDIHAYTLCMAYLGFYKPTQGEQMLRNAAERRFLCFPYCPSRKEPFDYTVANSPMVTYFTPLYTSGPCGIQNLDNPQQIEEDSLMRKMLANPQPCLDVMIRLYSHYRMKNGQMNIQGTTLQRYLEAKALDFENALTHLKRHIQGYDNPMYMLPPNVEMGGIRN